MKIVIPAKTNSTRVLDKNWREFHDGKCMVQIKIEQLLDAGIEPEDIYVFCEDQFKKKEVINYDVKFVLRRPETTANDMHWSDVITELVSSVECPESESVAWVYACTPLFEAPDFQAAIHMWETMQGPVWDQKKYDCLITVKPFKEFVLDEKGRPVNFSFGRWHEWSQDLPQWFILESPIHIMKKGTYLRCNYYIGERPYLYVVRKPSIDIDTPEEFQLAQEIYAGRHPVVPVVERSVQGTSSDLP